MIYMPSNNLSDYASYVPFLKSYRVNALVYGTKRNNSHRSCLAFLWSWIVFRALYININVCRNQADNLLHAIA